MACSCQVQGQDDVEGKCEDRQVQLAEDGIQGTRNNWAEDRREQGLIAVSILRVTLPYHLWLLYHPPSPLCIIDVPGSLKFQWFVDLGLVFCLSLCL